MPTGPVGYGEADSVELPFDFVSGFDPLHVRALIVQSGAILVKKTIPCQRLGKEFMESATSFGQRLAEERTRLGRSQVQLAALIGVTKQSVLQWEADSASPKAVYLAAMDAEGIDVLYLVTGRRSVPVQDTLTPRQRALLTYYDAASVDGKRFIEGAAMRAMQGTAEGTFAGVHQSNSAPGAVQVGNASGNVTIGGRRRRGTQS